MRDLLIKEIRLGTAPAFFLFLLCGLTFFIPGYPVLCGIFFITLGFFQIIKVQREENDILFSALLPVAKSDIIKSKYLFACMFELCGLIIPAAAVILRATALSDARPYRENALMNANLFALGAAFVLYGLFNSLFLGGFFKTAYKFGKPFIVYGIVCFAVIFTAEALHYIPGLEFLNAFGTEDIAPQLVLFAAGIAAFLLLTFISLKKACRNFEKTDL